MAKRPFVTILAAVCGLAVAAPAQADALLSGVAPGLLAPADTPATCETLVSQPFARWQDTSNYVLVPGGAFEPGGRGWTLGGGARVVTGNEPFYVRAAGDRYSLSLPAGSSATTPPACFASGDWHMRFFLVGSGTLRVKIVVKSLLEIVSVLDGGTVSGSSTWRPSPEVGLLLTNVTGLIAIDSVSFRFVPAGRTSVRIDDVYLDPWKVG